MPLTAGTKLGPYEIQSPLGAGGMGEVYRARDTRLDRIVAIKILATHLASSPELKQRMEREARSISALNHPHICHLYDIGSQDGTDFLVMEFLEGETLAERLRKGALPLPEILKIGIAIAEALAVAHRQGIVHRDLKPGNIMLTQSGAKLMDFGLAKPLGPQNSGVSSGTAVPSFTAAPTMSGPSPLTPLTTAGSIVGTIQYMSPEQIEGKEADARSDIFAFGAVLYEMAAGKRPFSGKSQLSLASSILENDPEPISAAKPLMPSAFEHIVTTCLQKNPEDRFQTAHDIKLELQWIASDKPSATTTNVTAQPAPPNPRERIGWAAAIVAALVVAAILGAAAGMFLYRPQPARAIRTVINPPDKAVINLAGDAAGPPVLSPDGTSIAFTATGADGKVLLWTRPMNSVDARSLAGTDDATFPFWSPDGQSVGFFSDGKLKTVEVNGGPVQAVCDSLLARGGTWSASGTIVFSPGPSTPLLRVSAAGGTPVPFTKIDTTQHTSHRWPFFLPDGKHLIYFAIHHDPSKAANNTLYYASLDGKENRPLFRSQTNAVYAAGFLLFGRGDQLMAQSFDPANGSTSGEPRVLARGVMNDPATWHMDASAADNGLLVFGSGGSGDLQLLWMDREKKEITTIADKFSNLQAAAISPQGDRVALQIDTGVNDIWVLDLARGVRTRLTFGPVANVYPVWSPDGKWIAYMSFRGERFSIYRRQSDGSGAEQLLTSDERELRPNDWSHDGKTLIYSRSVTGNLHGSDIWALPLEGEGKPSLVLSQGFLGRLSPDGHWLSYASGESGSPEIYVVALGGGQGKWQVSSNGGVAAKWSADGKELYYISPTYSLFAVPVKEAGSALQFGAVEVLVNNWSAPQVFFDITPDGKKILLDRISQQVSQSVTVVTNFTEGLKK
jgi:eukaryotic-like serine/threonine-protein kinase